jgi:hypothetical protein
MSHLNEEGFIKIEDLREDQMIKYSRSYVAFVDVLGFREIVLKSRGVVSLYHSTIKRSLNEVNASFQDYGKIDYQIMSDSIVFSVTPLSEKDGDKLLGLKALCGALLYLQFYLAVNGIWVRGGISYGEISFHDSNFVAGPALVRSVELEKIARFPRIILEPAILKDLKLGKREFLKQIDPNPDGFIWKHNDMDHEDFADFLFINFGLFLYNDLKFNEQASRLISGHLKKGLYGEPKHLQKYRWIERYIRTLPLKSECAKYFESL